MADMALTLTDEFRGKRVLVTGGSRGIGLAISKQLDRRVRDARLRPSFAAAGTACSYRSGSAVSSRGGSMRQNGYADKAFFWT